MSELARREMFERVIGEIHAPVSRYVKRRVSASDAEDVISDVMLAIWRRLEDVPEDPLPWSYAIARYAIANKRRGQQRHLRLIERLGAEPSPRSAPAPDESHDHPDLETALMELPEADRELLRLWAWEQLEAREIATVLAISPNAAALRLSRARSKLEAKIRRQSGRLGGHVLDENAQESA